MTLSLLRCSFVVTFRVLLNQRAWHYVVGMVCVWCDTRAAWPPWLLQWPDLFQSTLSWHVCKCRITSYYEEVPHGLVLVIWRLHRASTVCVTVHATVSNKHINAHTVTSHNQQGGHIWKPLLIYWCCQSDIFFLDRKILSAVWDTAHRFESSDPFRV